MTCSKDFGRLLQASCLGLIGMLAVAGCGGSETKPKNDGGANDGGGDGQSSAALNVNPPSVNIGTLGVNGTGLGSVVVTNNGRQQSGAITVTTSTPEITVQGCAGQKLDGGASCTITITVKPLSVNSFTGTVSISATPGAQNPLVVPVLGNVTPHNMFTVQPATIELGNVSVGVAAPKQTIVVTAAVAISDLAVSTTGQDVTIDSVASTCTPVLAASATCNIVVNFVAAASGPRSNQVVISGGGSTGLTVNVPITATAIAPAKLSISPSTQQPVSTAVGTPSSPIPFLVTNTGGVATGQVTAALGGAAAAHFTIASNNCGALAPSASCTIAVVYQPVAPTGATPELATLTVTDTGPGATTVSVGIAGTAVSASALTITSATSDLGSVLVNTTGPATIFTVANGGDTASGPLSVTISSAEFFKSDDTCTGTSLVAKTGTCTISIALKPVTPGFKNAVLTVAGTAASAVKNITGTGTSPAGLTATPPSLDFKDVRINSTGTAQTVTVKNVGDSPTGTLSFTKTGDFGEFPMESNNCSAALAPDATCTFSINFKPTTAGSRSARYTLSDGTVSVSISVAGNALAEAGIEIKPAMVNATTDPAFAPTVVASTSTPITFTVTANTLPAGATDTGVITPKMMGTHATDFTVKQNNCTSALVLKASCTIVVTFTPTAAGLRDAVLNVTTATGGSANASLQAEGLPILAIYAIKSTSETRAADELSQDPADFDFGQVALNSSSGGEQRDFRVIARGPVSTATPYPTNVVALDLADPSTSGSNFSYPQGLNAVNPCTGATLTISGTSHANVTATGGAIWRYAEEYAGYYCDFTIQFLPQGAAKGEKTATLTATGSGTTGGADSKAIKGTATGPLTINLRAGTIGFPASVAVGSSTNSDSQLTMVGGYLVQPNVTLDVMNESSSVTLGPPMAIALTGDQFAVVYDECTNNRLTPGASCMVVVAFTPTSAGAKAGTVVASGGGETSEPYNLTCIGTDNLVTLTPVGTKAAPIDIGSGSTTVTPIVVGTQSQWRPFKITNPAGSPKTGQIGGWEDLTAPFAGSGNAGTDMPCGLPGTKALNPGESCNIWVQYSPPAGTAPATVIPAGATSSASTMSTLVVTVNDRNFESVISGTPSGRLQITTAQATKTVANVAYYDFGNAVSGELSTAVTFTLANLDTAAALTVNTPSGASIAPFSIVTGGTCSVSTGGQITLQPASATATTDECTLILKMTGGGEAGASYDSSNVVFSDANGTSSVTVRVMGTTVMPASLKAMGLGATQTIDLGTIVNPNTTASAVVKIINTGSVAATNLTFAWLNADGTVKTDCSPNRTITDGDTCGPYVINTEAADTCWKKASLASNATAGAYCTLAISSKPISTAAEGAGPTVRLGLYADGGISVGTQITVATTIRTAAVKAHQQYFQYGTSTVYGFLPFTAPVALGQASDQVIVTLWNKDPDNGTPLPAATAAAWTALLGGLCDDTECTDGDAATVCLCDYEIAPAGSQPCPATTLAANSSCTIGVKFAPKAAYLTDGTNAVRYASLVLESDNSLGLMGEVKAPAKLSMTPTTLDFGEVGLGTSATLTATVTNVGGIDATDLGFETTNPTHYAVSGCGTTLAAGQTCTITVVATPDASSTTPVTGNVRATFTGGSLGVVTAAGNNSPTVGSALTMVGLKNSAVSLTGTGLVVVNSDTKRYTFDPVVVGHPTGAALEITITNDAASATTGPLSVEITGETASYTLVPNTCKSGDIWKTLSAGGSCSVYVVFNPANTAGTTVTGDRLATLTVKATPGTPTTGKIVQFTGKTTPALTFEAPLSTTLTGTSVAVGTSLDIFVRKNVAAQDIMDLMSTAAISGDDAAAFFISRNDCLFNALSGNNYCQMTVQYIGGSTTTEKKTTLKVSDGSVGFTNSIVLTHPAS